MSRNLLVGILRIKKAERVLPSQSICNVLIQPNLPNAVKVSAPDCCGLETKFENFYRWKEMTR